MNFVKNRNGIGLIMIGATLLIAAFIVFNWHTWNPVKTQVKLDSLEEQSTPTFETDMDAEYLIQFEVERNLPFRQVNCLLGIREGGVDDCNGIEALVDLNWSVIAGDDVVAHGSSADETSGTWGEKIARTVGRFRATRGQSYQLNYRLNRSAALLDNLKPLIVIRTHSFQSKGYSVVAYSLGFLSVPLLLIGAVTMLRRRGEKRSFE